MQNNLVFIYKNITEVQINDTFSRMRNRVVYADDLVVFKGIDNVLYFQFKNQSQRRVDITNKEFSIKLFDERSAERQMFINLPLTVVDATTGVTTVTISEQYIDHIELGKYEYAIEMREGGLNEATYVDDNFGMRGVVDVRLGGQARLRESAILSFDNVTKLTNVSDAGTRSSHNNGLHTIIAKFDNYTGDLVIQATMDNIFDQFITPNFFNVATLSYTDQTENIVYTFNGIFSGVRFSKVATTGDILEVQYRY